VDDIDHASWVCEIKNTGRVVVTVNEKDKALEISNIYHNKTLKNSRLGNVKKESDNCSIEYKDFTGAKNIGFGGHTIFLTTPGENAQIYDYFKTIIGE
ncbi:MAG: hypothetical protein AB2541_00880, partial [Candidatus Thiodiazotropha sp.]